jgi:hypothetical protein
MADSVSRRGFLRHAACAPVAGVAGSPAVAEPIQQAWIIIGVNWEYNDEYTYPDGEQALPKVYLDQKAAEAECQRLCQQFFEQATPLDWEVDFVEYEPELPDDVSEETVTWDQLRQAGFPEPYYVQEMEV